ncbi:SCO family protein [Pseudoalteromonas sp. MMG013]|uniref:SCO family protein n=1 Tax=Pseudoalteromonas sp. MMG013 TaxID=2822687 RepID=UPI001B35EF40|nr:SCO family protein [Pseudoalteromonas sp. MMG013]MBQ4863814.1 SCO family protein [Pseudoalteromonas sp. MMG013]
MRYILFGIVSVLLLGCSEKPVVSDLTVHYQQPKLIKQFALTDQHGETLTEQDLLGQWTLLFLGYTSCPDICPMTLAKLAQVHQRLQNSVPLSIWFISVDPQRDTVEKRQAYIDYFNHEFKAMSGPHATLFPFVRDIGLIYAINNSEDSEYYVDHSASVALINPNGELAAIFKAKYTANEIPLIDVATLISDFNLIAM